jgi:hypothetical protein
MVRELFFFIFQRWSQNKFGNHCSTECPITLVNRWGNQRLVNRWDETRYDRDEAVGIGCMVRHYRSTGSKWFCLNRINGIYRVVICEMII